MEEEKRVHEVSTNDVSVLAGVSPSTVLLWKRENKLPVHRVTGGGHFKFDLDVVEAFLDKRRQKRDAAFHAFWGVPKRTKKSAWETDEEFEQSQSPDRITETVA